MFEVSKKTLVIIGLILCAFILVYVTGYITMAVIAPSMAISGVSDSGSDSEFAKRYKRLDEVYELLIKEYYEEPDGEKLIKGAIDGMLSSLEDPYTFYYTQEEMAAMQEDHEGKYYGVGMLISSDKEGQMTVLRVFKDSPAMKAGILPGDIIIAADGVEVSAKTAEIMDEAVSRIKGEENTEVILTVIRKNEKLDIPVLRGKVNVNRVEYQILEGNIGYLVLYEFFGDAVKGVQEAFEAFKKAGVDGVIFDVRSNTGGQLDICLNIADMILPEGLIVSIKDRAGEEQKYYSKASRYSFPMVILVNEMSASASELLTAAAKDYNVAKIVGKTTYGKGVVQTVHQFYTDNAGMQLTTSSYYSPKGTSIHKTGVQPDVEVDMWESYDASIYAPDMNNDNQLKTAYDVLMEMIKSK